VTVSTSILPIGSIVTITGIQNERRLTVWPKSSSRFSPGGGFRRAARQLRGRKIFPSGPPVKLHLAALHTFPRNISPSPGPWPAIPDRGSLFLWPDHSPGPLRAHRPWWWSFLLDPRVSPPSPSDTARARRYRSPGTELELKNHSLNQHGIQHASPPGSVAACQTAAQSTIHLPT
jgi:hypothetical protein